MVLESISGIRALSVAGLAIAAAFFSKQTASIIGVGLGVGLLAVNWRRALVCGGAAAGSPPGYERRQPEQGTLHRVVRENLRTPPEGHRSGRVASFAPFGG